MVYIQHKGLFFSLKIFFLFPKGATIRGKISFDSFFLRKFFEDAVHDTLTSDSTT